MMFPSFFCFIFFLPLIQNGLTKKYVAIQNKRTRFYFAVSISQTPVWKDTVLPYQATVPQ